MNEQNYAELARRQRETIRRQEEDLAAADVEIRSLRRQLKQVEKQLAVTRRAAAAERNLNSRVAVLEFVPKQKIKPLTAVKKASRKAERYRKIA